MSVEASVISAVCKNKDISTIFASDIDECFVAYKDVWEGLKSYYHKFRSVPDINVLTDKFSDFESVSVHGETDYYVDQLRNEYLAGRMRDALLTGARSLESDSAPRVLANLQTELLSLGRLVGGAQDLDLTDIDSASKHFEEVLHRSDKKGGSPGIPTGIKAIDASYVTGMAPGHLIVAIGWPGRGKTWATGWIAVNAWKAGFKPMIVSLEMSPENMRDRLYTVMGEGMFRASDLSRGRVNVDDFRSWGKKNFADKDGFIIVSPEGSSEVTPNMVQAKIDQHKPDLVICDYHQLFMDNKRSDNMTQRAMNLSRELKMLATSNQIPVIDITAATMSDSHSQDDPPMLSQVAWSKAIEYDADMAFAVHRHSVDSAPGDPAVIEIISRKNRHGGDFGCMIEWDIDRGVIKEIYS